LGYGRFLKWDDPPIWIDVDKKIAEQNKAKAK
jgi:hypothetical protein